jgi:hypothetical protein
MLFRMLISPQCLAERVQKVACCLAQLIPIINLTLDLNLATSGHLRPSSCGTFGTGVEPGFIER